MARETRGYCLPTEAGMIPRHMRLPHAPAQHPQHFHCCNQKARNPLQQNGGNCLPWGSRETSCGCPACGTIPQGHAQLCRPGDQDCQGETGPQTHKGGLFCECETKPPASIQVCNEVYTVCGAFPGCPTRVLQFSILIFFSFAPTVLPLYGLSLQWNVSSMGADTSVSCFIPSS